MLHTTKAAWAALKETSLAACKLGLDALEQLALLVLHDLEA